MELYSDFALGFKNAVCGLLQEAPHMIMVELAGFVVGAFEV